MLSVMLESAPSLAKDNEHRVDLRHAHNPCTSAEIDSCNSAVRGSIHTHMKVLPNHHVGTDAELHGYYFSCSPEDTASVLPMDRRMFDMISMYECVDDEEEQAFSPYALKIVNELAHYKEVLRKYADELRENPMMPARFDCIADQNVFVGGASSYDSVDAREWKPELPMKMGVYHTFTRSSSKTTRKHKLFVVISGPLTQAAEELHNLWQDSAAHMSCKDFLQCEELNWLRTTTHRNHNRVASDIGVLFGMKMNHVADTDDPGHKRSVVFPTTCTYKRDIGRLKIGKTDVVRLVDSGCFTDLSNNGVLFEMFSSEGYWLFQGPRDFADNNAHGSMFASTNEASCQPTSTVQYHRLHPAVHRHNTVRVESDTNCDTSLQADDHQKDFLFPDESFLAIMQELGFNRNDGMLNIMPLVYYNAEQ